MVISEHKVVKCAQAALSEMFRKEELCEKKILVGLSGGADSVSLALCLCALSGKYGFSVLCAHINHMIRGAEADRDEEFARELCKRLGIEFYSTRINVPLLSKEQKKGLEEAARDVRYEYLEGFIKSGKADFIATAHTASDNAETVIMNMTRGCGLSGLCGIPMRRGSIIRPLIYASRRDIEDYLSELGESYVTDSTNLEDDCSRNVIRHRIIPELSVLNPAFTEAVSNMTHLAKRENDFLERLANESYTDNICALAKLDTVLRARIIAGMYKDKCGNFPEMKHIDMLCTQIQKVTKENNGERRIFNLPNGISAVFECGKLLMVNEAEIEKEEFCEYEIYPDFGINELRGGRMLAVMCKESEDKGKFCRKLEYNKNIYSLFMEAKLFSDIIKGKILLRSGKAGDKIRICNMSKSVKKLFSAKKIPVNERNSLPRICDSKTGEILALPYTGLCDAALENAGKSDIIIKLYKLTTRSDFETDEK